ncbi:MAG: protein disulfide-isomerase precursor [Peltula sp. TS41687]|nr:MAG: protein disulfide-isomerase precursor [Peltula sp. TS41687]
MRNLINSALALFGVAAVTSGSDVHDLKKDTFEPFMEKHDLVLAESLAPEYEEAAKTLKEKNIPLIKVDCTEETELCQSYGVEGYPTVKVFRGKDDHAPYMGARKAQAIVSYMIKLSMPAVSIIDEASLDEFKAAESVVLVAFIDPSDKASNETLTSVANSLREKYIFGAIHDKKAATAQGVKQPAIVLYKQFDEGKNVFDEKFDKEKIESFIKSAAIPLVGEVGPETYADYIASGLPLAYIFAETEDERSQLADELRPVAEKYKGAVNFATIDAKAFGAHAGNLNLETDNFPAFAIQETVKNQKFPYDQSKKITAKDISDFVEGVVEGTIKPSVKSEPVPESQDGPVHVVVAHNYEEIVMDNDKDVLLEYYAPWCGHCKALAPKYEELAALYFNSPDLSKKVTVAKVDATANDVPDEIAGFPTIKLFPAGSKESPIEYSGSRTIEDLANFIKENGKHQVEAPMVGEDDVEMPDADSMGKQAPAASKKVKDAAEAATDSAASAKDRATDSAASVKDKATDSAASAKDRATDSAASVKDKATDAASSVKSKATEGAGSVKDKVVDKAASAASQATKAVKDKSASVGTATEAVKESGASAKGKAADKSASAKGKVKSGASDASQKVKDTATDATKSASSASKGVKEAVKSKISQGAEAVKSAVTDGDDMEDLEHDEL